MVSNFFLPLVHFTDQNKKSLKSIKMLISLEVIQILKRNFTLMLLMMKETFSQNFYQSPGKMDILQTIREFYISVCKIAWCTQTLSKLLQMLSIIKCSKW